MTREPITLEEREKNVLALACRRAANAWRDTDRTFVRGFGATPDRSLHELAAIAMDLEQRLIDSPMVTLVEEVEDAE